MLLFSRKRYIYILTQDITDQKYYLYTNNNNFYCECSTSLENCFKCENKAKCLECITSYLIEEKDISIPYSLFQEKLYYFDNYKYYSCSKILNCEKCTSKDKCIQCKQDFYFIKDNSGNFICENIDISKYYSSIEGDITFYTKCDKAIDNCNECNKKDYCTKCKNNFGIIGNDHTKCEDLLEQKYYYNSILEQFRLFNEEMPNCHIVQLMEILNAIVAIIITFLCI